MSCRDSNVTKRIEKYKDGRIFGRIKIENNSFIGINCVLLPGVHIGNNCILGAGSVLTKSMPDNTVYGGIPAKFICTIDQYGENILKNSIKYPLSLEKNRKDLEKYLIENLPYTYKEY